MEDIYYNIEEAKENLNKELDSEAYFYLLMMSYEFIDKNIEESLN